MSDLQKQTPPTGQDRGTSERGSNNNHTPSPQKVNGRFDKDAVKNAVDCRRYLTERLGSRQIDGDRYTAPWRKNEGESNPALAVQKKVWTDHKDGDSGDIFSLIQKSKGVKFYDALREAAEFAGIEPNDGDAQKIEPWRAVWSQATNDLEGIRRYLQSRGLSGDVPSGFKYHSSLKHKSGDEYPAMVAPVVDASGNQVAIHRTYLSKDSDGKANISPSKMMLGQCVGCSVHLFGVHVDILALTEGIETGLAVQVATGLPTWACLNTSGLKSVRLPDEIKTVYIFGDVDELGKNGKRPGQEAAAKVAERLAAEGRQVFVVIPDCEGDDWLDVLNQDGPEAIQRAMEAAEAFKRDEKPRESRLSGKPVLLLPCATSDQYQPIYKCAEELFSLLSKENRFFLRGGNVVEVVREGGAEVFRDVSPDEFRSKIEHDFIPMAWRSKQDGSELKTAIVSRDTTKALLAASEKDKLTAVQGLLNCPMLLNDGRVIGRGIDADTGWYVTGGSAEDVSLDDAVELLHAILEGFDFLTPGDKARAMISFLNPTFRLGRFFDRVPIDVGEADDSQSGKTYRQTLVALVYGEEPHYISQKKGGVGSVDESFGTTLLQGRPFILFDNWRGRMDSE